MAGSCWEVGQTRRREWSPDEDPKVCEPPKEDPDAARVRANREAEAHQNAWISSGDHDAGISRSAMSARGKAPTSSSATEADLRRAENAKRAEVTRRLDPPIEGDPLGNAVVGVIASGIFAGFEAAATHGARAIAGSIARHTAEHVAADAVEHAAHAAGHAAAEKVDDATRKVDDALPQPTPKVTGARSEPRAGPAPSSAGRSSPNGTSEVAPEPNRSEVPAVRGQDRVPYRPGEAPLRIPEAPQSNVTSMAFVVRG